jgi:hypothetical protein
MFQSYFEFSAGFYRFDGSLWQNFNKKVRKTAKHFIPLHRYTYGAVCFGYRG